MKGGVETAFAKINLALHVRRREASGYHAIETLFAFAEDGDVLHLVREPGLKITGPFADQLSPDRDNLVVRAAEAFSRLTGNLPDVGFALDKRLPVAAGIGGGSADAAAALRLLCRMYGIDPQAPEILNLARTLGADVPACLLSRPARGEGHGDRLAPVANLVSGQPLLLVNPMQPVATATVFAGWDGIDRGRLADGDPIRAARAGRNDLETSAIRVAPAIGMVLDLLRSQSRAHLVRMSGSGATCFALFADDQARDDAARAIAGARPEWWLLATRLR